ncbi:MAG: MFS transporter [Cryomorphaceae bacterium]|jgi:MFS family permease|nr:MFS transporter [Cryomorphaceae bacterium]
MLQSYSRNFWLLSFAMFLFMTSFNLIMPELNQFITSLGGADQKGLVISLFTISAGFSRPFSGKLSDLIGRKKVMWVGIIICFIVSLLYPLSFSVWFFLTLRFIHGFSAGFSPTGATALVTDLLPDNNRGAGMGIWGTFISLGIGIGQSLGSYIQLTLGMTNLFIIAAIFSALAAILLHAVTETLERPVPFELKHLKITWKDVFEPSVLPAAIVMFLSAMCSGIIFVLTPDLSGFLGISNKGFFFGIYVISTIVIRLLTSSLSDRIGRRKALLIGMSILAISMVLIAFAKDVQSYILASVVFGLATGMSSPTLFAWTADLSHKERRGVGAGTMFIALELGIMAGSLSTMLIYSNTMETIKGAFLIGAGMAVLCLLFLIFHLKTYASESLPDA